jgi:hypothetical protein
LALALVTGTTWYSSNAQEPITLVELKPK